MYWGQDNKLKDGISFAKLMDKTEAESIAHDIGRFFQSVVLSIKDLNDRIRAINKGTTIRLPYRPHNLQAYEAQIRFWIWSFVDQNRKIPYHPQVVYYTSLLKNINIIMMYGDYSGVPGIDRLWEKNKDKEYFPGHIFGVKI